MKASSKRKDLSAYPSTAGRQVTVFSPSLHAEDNAFLSGLREALLKSPRTVG